MLFKWPLSTLESQNFCLIKFVLHCEVFTTVVLKYTSKKLVYSRTGSRGLISQSSWKHFATIKNDFLTQTAARLEGRKNQLEN